MKFVSFISMWGAAVLLTFPVFSQIHWEPDVAEKYALLQDNNDSTNYQTGYQAYQWLKRETPDLNENIYIFGSRVIRQYSAQEENMIERRRLFDELVELYDLRMTHFGDKQQLSIKKAFDLYSLNIPGSSVEVCKAFEEAFLLNRGNLPLYMLTAYMDVAIDGYKEGTLLENEVISIYLKIKKAFYTASLSGTNADVSNRHEAVCDNLFLKTVKMDCKQIKEKFVEQFDPSAENSFEVARIIVKLSLTHKCTEEPYFAKVLDIYHQKEPSYEISSYLANKMKKEGRLAEAGKYYFEMVELSKNAEEKSKAYLLLASLYLSEDKIKARNFLKKALEENPEMKEAYYLLGELYFYSAEECSEGASKVKDRLNYLAAYEKYRLAGSKAGMEKATAQFPSIDDIHFEGFEENKTLLCGCWINEEVVLKRRPKE